MYPSKPLLISSGVASVRWLEAKFGRSGRMNATLTCPPGSYMMRPRALGPRGESVRSLLAHLIFHDTSFHVPKNCSLTEREAGRSGLRGTRAAISREAEAVMRDMATLMLICLTTDWMRPRREVAAQPQTRPNAPHPTHPAPRA